jgi:hypothetical protein
LVAALEHFASRRLWLQLPAEGQRLWADTFCPARFQQRMTQHLEQLWLQHQGRLSRARAPLPLAVPLT